MNYLKIFIKFIIKNTFLNKFNVEIFNFLLIPKNILRYYGFVKIDYKLSKTINFGSKKANNFFLKKIKTSKKYFEYGAGSSTLIANKYSNLYLSVESDDHFGKFCRKKYNLKLLIRNFGPVSFYSWPIFKNFRKKSLYKKVKNYSSSINYYCKKHGFPDFLLIDGRCRVLCALMVHDCLIKYKKKILLLLLMIIKIENIIQILVIFFTLKL